MFCRKCGKILSDSAKYCPYCGVPTVDATVTKAKSDNNRSEEEVQSDENNVGNVTLYLPSKYVVGIVLSVIGIILLISTVYNLTNSRYKYCVEQYNECIENQADLVGNSAFYKNLRESYDGLIESWEGRINKYRLRAGVCALIGTPLLLVGIYLYFKGRKWIERK